MKVQYDPEVDVLSIVLSEAPIEESDEDKPGVILDYDKDGNVVGLEILDASKRMGNPCWSNMRSHDEPRMVHRPRCIRAMRAMRWSTSTAPSRMPQRLGHGRDAGKPSSMSGSMARSSKTVGWQNENTESTVLHISLGLVGSQ
jgi:uncharacterized protein YuzE